MTAYDSNDSGRIVVDGLDASAMTDEFIGLLRQGGVNCVHKSVGHPYSFGPVLRFVDRHASDVVMARTAEQILQAKQNGKIAIVCGSQAASLHLSDLGGLYSSTFASLVSALRTEYEMGLRTLGICYNVASIFGGGCLDPTAPLTRVGRRLVEETHKLRILLDVGGHTGEQTSLDALAMSSGVPVVCTHTNIAALNANPRATSDRVLEAIAKTGGVVGLTAVSEFMTHNASSAAQGLRSPQAPLDVLLDQYDYLKRLVGADHVALGPDFIWGRAENLCVGTEDSVLFPPDMMSENTLDKVHYVKDFDDISKLPALERGLAERGWSRSELDKLLGANWIRVYRAAWGK
jgi:membrane dipeptidase